MVIQNGQIVGFEAPQNQNMQNNPPPPPPITEETIELKEDIQ